MVLVEWCRNQKVNYTGLGSNENRRIQGSTYWRQGGCNRPDWSDFYEPGMVGIVAHAVKQAYRLGIELSINIQSGFGDPGYPNFQPDNGMKKIVFSEVKVSDPRKIQEEMNFS